MAWQHVDAWTQAARELNVSVSGPVRLELRTGEIVEADLLFHEFGSAKGTLVIAGFERHAHHEAIAAEGYGLSRFYPPPEGYIYSAQDLIDLLSDWGWCGDEQARPAWLREPED